MSIIPKINKTARAGTARAKEQYVFIAPVSDIATFPVLSMDTVVISALPTLIATKEFDTIYATGKTISLKDEVSGDVDCKAFLTTVAFSHPGDETAINDFIQKNANQGVVLLSAIRSGESHIVKIAGTPSNPLYLSLEEQDDSEAVRKTLTFKQEQGDEFKTQMFTGALPTITPAPVVPPEGVNV